MTQLRDEVKAVLTPILMRAPGADLDAVVAQFNDALAEFTRDSLSWQAPRTLVTVAGERLYQIPAPYPTSAPTWIVAAENADGTRLSTIPGPYGVTEARLAADPAVGPPRVFSCPSPGALYLHPTPDDAYTVYLTMSFTATSHEAPVPPFFLTTYQAALLDGTLHRLFATPNTPYFNLRLAEFHGRRFRNGISSARITVRRQMALGLHQVIPFPTPAAGRI